MPPFTRAVVTALLAAPLMPALHAQQPAAVFPVSATQGGVTVTLSSARWAKRGDVFPGEGQGGAADKGLELMYHVSNKWVVVTPRFLGADGQPLPRLTPQTITDGTGGKAFFTGLDPRLATFSLGFEWFDPAAPPEASGSDAETLDFPGVPVPPAADRTVAVDRVLTTKHGTRVTLLKVGLHKTQPGDAAPSETLLIMRCEPPAAVPDLYASLYFAYPGLFDDRGKNLMTNASYGASTDDPLDHTPGTVTLSVASVPSPGAKTLDIKVRVREDAPSLRQEQWFRHVKFTLPLASLPGRDAVGPYQPLATAASGPVQSTLESLRSPAAGQYEARLWLADEYDFQNIALHDDAGNDYTSVDDTSDGPPIFWRANGAPLEPGKRAHRLGFYTFHVKSAPTRLSLELAVRPVRRVHHVFDLADLPIPKPGETATVDRTVTDADGGRLTARAVSYFTAQKPLPGLDAPTLAQVAPSSGVALAVRFQPAGGSAADPKIECLSAVDDQGHILTGRHGLSASATDYLQTGEAPANSETVLLLPPAGGDASSRFRVQIGVDETVPDGPAHTLRFPGLAAPVPTH